jgi:tetratricopeptide (TPR) repeat protein
MSSACQEAYRYALVAISAGLQAHDKKIADEIERHYLQAFAKQYPLSSEELPTFRASAAESLKDFARHKDKIFQIKEITDEDLMALISYKDRYAFTDLVLEQMQGIAPLDETLAAFLRYEGQLGDSVLFFIREIIRKDERLKKTQAALLREGLCLEVRKLEESIEHLKAIQENSPFLGEQIAPQLTQLQLAQSIWEIRHDQQIRFSHCFENHLEEMLEWAKDLYSTLTYEDDVKSLVEEILQKLSEMMARYDLSSQIKARDEFIRHNNASLQLIRKAASQLKKLSPPASKYSRFFLALGSALSSIGEPAEHLFLQVIENNSKESEKALAYFNLFQVQLRRQAYSEALKNLQAAIAIDPDKYALHDIHKYPLEKFLGAGGMGCVFLCRNNNPVIKKKWVVVKCFWEKVKGFKEAIAMRDIAEVPEPLDFGYLDVFKQERAFFVTEYIEGAIDGETWLEKYGSMDLKTGLAVGLQIAEDLQFAHDMGIYHLYLKPANVLLKQTETGIAVKITDFGLSPSVISLRSQAQPNQASKFGQAVFSSLDYVPPEHNKLTVINDIFAFGATMYRLLTGLNPRYFFKEKLPDVPALRDLLFDCIEGKDGLERELFSQLKAIEKSQRPKQRLSCRYIDNGDGTVTDNKTGLVWLKNANCFGRQNWKTALESVANLAHGQYGLSDGSTPSMWRLPTKEEWEAMVDKRYEKPALANAAETGQWTEGDAFLGVQASYYWSSTTDAELTSFAWYAYLYYGYVDISDKTYFNYVWPVR